MDKVRWMIALVLVLTPLAGAGEVKIETDDQKTLYAVGLSLARNLGSLNLTEAELAVVEAGISDGVLGRPPKADLQTYAPKIQKLMQDRQATIAAAEKKVGEDFLKKAAGEKGAVKTDSGLIYIETQAGSGAPPTPDSTVKVHYTGTLRDGTVFDSSVKRGQPATFPLKQVIPCWTEGLQKMKVGGKAKIVCPSNIAYGDRGAPGTPIKPGSTLVFEVELLEIVKQ